MKHFLIGLFIICFSGSLVAQIAQTDKKAEEILKGVSQKYKSYKSVKATFSVAIENPRTKTTDTQKGTLYLRGNKYRLEIAGQDVISDGKTRWTYLQDANEIQIDNQRQDDQSITPSNVFTMYEKGWLYKYTGEQKSGNSVVQMIELIPTEGKAKNIFKVKLNIHKTDRYILSAKMFDKNGNIQTITLDKMMPDAVNDDALFTFNTAKYPGAEVIDLR